MDNKVTVKVIRSDDQEFTFNGDGGYWRITELDNFGSLENDITTIDNGVGDGAYISSSRIAHKDRTIVAKSKDPSLNDVLRKNALSFFNPRYTYKMYISYMGTTRWCDAVLHKIQFPNGNTYRTMTLTVTFMSASPWLKSVEDFGEDITEITPMEAFPYMCAKSIGHTAGIYNFASSIMFTNDGDVETYCKAIFTASGSVENPKLIINDAYVRVIDSMVKGDVIVMDFASNPPTITKNGVNCMGKCDRKSDFDKMVLGIGETSVSFATDDGTDNLAVNIFYNKLFLGI